MATRKRPVRPKPAVGKKKFVRYGHRSQDRIFQETYVYLMANIPFFMFNKFGISDKTKQRRQNVSETTPGLVQTVMTFNLAFGYEVEQFVHRLYKLQNFHFWAGSGRTEWFLVFSPIVGAVQWYLNYRFHFQFSERQLWLGFFTPFIWWDGLLWLLIFRSLKLVALLAVTFFIIYALAHIK